MPHYITQLLTGVREQYRGRGLGKWLKAQMLFCLRDKYPSARYISTGNATVNAPMLSINNRMGFKVYKEMVVYKFQMADLRERLKA